MKKTSLCFAAVFAVLFGFFVASCSGGADSPNLTLYMQPSGGSSDSGGGTQTPTPTPMPTPPAEYNVTYVITNGSDDMTGESRSSGKYTVQSELTIPQKEGFQFKGWYSDQEQTQAVASFAGLTGDVTLYGHWAGTLYTVLIEGIDGATLAEGSLAVTGFSTEDTTLSLPAYTKRFYDFAGLYLDSEFNGTAVTQIGKDSAEAGGTLTLYAKWTLIEYNVTYVITNGSDGMTSELRTSGKYSGESELTIPEKEGFQFKGWYLDAEQTQAASTFADLTGDLILYGHWAGTLYTVQMEGIEGSYFLRNSRRTGGAAVTSFNAEDTSIALPVYYKDYYVFEGFYLDSEFNGTAITYINKDSAGIGTTLTLYGKWKEKVFAVNYDLLFESGVTNPNAITTVTALTAAKSFVAPTYVDDNYKFDGWLIKYEFNGRAHSDPLRQDTIVCIPEEQNEITLQAKWTHATPWSPDGAPVHITTMQTALDDIAKITLHGRELYLVVTDSRVTSQRLKTALKANSEKNVYLDFSAASSFYLSERAFEGCSNLTGITFPEDFYSIPEYAFKGCSKLKVVKIPDQVEIIGGHSFENCTELETIYLPKKLETIKRHAFFVDHSINYNTGTSKLKTAYYNSTYDDLKKGKFEDEYSKPTCYGGALYFLDQNGKDWKRAYSIDYFMNGAYWDRGEPTVFCDTDFPELPTLDNIGERPGYDFGGWYDNDKLTGVALTSVPSGKRCNVKYWAKWTPRNDTPYKVLHYQQNLGDSDYTLYETENLTGTTDSYVTPASKDYPGFVAEPINRQMIDRNGKTEMKIYYKRKTATLTLDLNGGTLDGKTGTITKSGKYGASVPALSNPQKTNYTFMGWNTNGGVLPSVYAEDATFTAVWLLDEVRGIDITVDPLSDISVTKSQSGNTVTFTAQECDSYSWALDGAAKGSARTCSIETSTLLKGTYTLTLEAKKGGKWFSYTAQIKVN